MPMADEDAGGWKAKALELQTKLDEALAAAPDVATVKAGEKARKELERLQGVHDKLRGEHETLKSKNIDLTARLLS